MLDTPPSLMLSKRKDLVAIRGLLLFGDAMAKAKNLKHLRIQAGLTQQELADALGVSRATVCAWERARTSIPVPSSKRIADYFGIRYEDFWGEGDFTAEEKHFVVKMRALPKASRELILDMVDLAFERANHGNT